MQIRHLKNHEISGDVQEKLAGLRRISLKFTRKNKVRKIISNLILIACTSHSKLSMNTN